MKSKQNTLIAIDLAKRIKFLQKQNRQTMDLSTYTYQNTLIWVKKNFNKLQIKQRYVEKYIVNIKIQIFQS